MTPLRRNVYLALAAVCVLVNWAMFRLHPRGKELTALTEEIVRLEPASAAAGQVRTLQAELAAIEEDLAAVGTTDAARPDPSLDLSSLAAECRLVVETATPFESRRTTYEESPQPVTSASGLAERMRRIDPERRLVRWSAWGDFAGLLAFLDHLPTLPGEPVVLELTIERKRHAGPPLLIRLLLAT